MDLSMSPLLSLGSLRLPFGGRPGLLAVLLGLFGAGCAGSSGLETPEAAAPRRPGAKPVLVLMPESPTAEQALDGLREELAADFDLVPRYVTRSTSPEDVGQAVREVEPVALVVMNNPTLRLVRTYRASAKATIPVVALLTAFLEESASGLENATGVIYEVPLVTSLVNLRDLLAEPVVKVGVLHRPGFASFVAAQRELVSGEGFEVVAREVEGGSVGELRDGLEQLFERDKVSALWILNDNALLDRRLIERGWLPSLARRKIPVVVNVGSLVSRQLELGTFGVLPDHRALGAQAGALLATLAENGFDAKGLGFEYPLSVEKVLDLRLAKEKLALRTPRLDTVDRLIE